MPLFDIMGRSFKPIHELFNQAQPIDILTVTLALKKSGDLELVGGPYYITQLTNRVASAANIEYHARIILQKYIQRELIRMSSHTITRAYEDTSDVLQLLDDTEKDLFSLFKGKDIHLKELVFNATEFSYGLPFRFQRGLGFELRGKRGHGYFGNYQVHFPQEAQEEVRLADIVAASSCFPLGFEPILFPHDFRHENSPRLDAIDEVLQEDQYGQKPKLPLRILSH